MFQTTSGRVAIDKDYIFYILGYWMKSSETLTSNQFTLTSPIDPRSLHAGRGSLTRPLFPSASISPRFSQLWSSRSSFFFDQNVSSLLCRRPAMDLNKSSAYNYDFVVVAVSLIITSLLGLPCTHGLIPQAPLHVFSLAKYKTTTENMNGVIRTVSQIDYIIETRLSNSIILAFIGKTILTTPLLRLIVLIPEAVLAGIFLYMGIGTLSHNEFTSQCHLFFCRSTYRPMYFKHIGKISIGSVLAYTGMQL